MIIGSLFSGIGGIEIGFERQGFETAWFIESDPYCQEVLKKRFPDTEIHGDITELNLTNLPRIDILTGGFPCQDISNAGKRAGIEGSRSSLWKYYCEAIRVLRPKFALIENVSALTNRGLDVVLTDLAEIGYDAEWHCISASSVGAPHQRERIFIVGYPCDDGQSATEKRTGFNERSNRTKEGQEQTCQPERPSEQYADVAHSNKERLQGREKARNIGSCREERKEQPLRFYSWSSEPELGRVADGIPNRTHRIKCLGNAVVPQCAEVFARAIKKSIT